ncbi:hypothetical protein [Patiriisocius hiemis]|uniref:Lipoprotein n=1 Tax=Patiriisocius hiemis TaxID=3075604 RepID=A0ABU2YEK2_9FLAO|nr:hypothetical protein [Constantimarinum sp. W242]MDT0556079.1 hypothetical protein [Constantimarinum sp. W242]
MKKIILLLICIALFSCASETEQKGLDTIASLYDATVSYSKDFNSSAGQETQRTFNVKVSNSSLIDSLQPSVTTANIAMLIFEGFTAEEQSKYDYIDVELISTKQDTAAITYNTKLVERVSKKSKNYKLFSKSLIEKDFATIDKIKSKKDFPKPIAAGLRQLIDELENEKGKLIRYQPFGVGETKNQAGEVAFQYQGFLIFENGRTSYFVYVEDVLDNDKIVGFRIL